jgi:hypothetical protein
VTPFFSTIEKQHALLDELESWRGTPFNRSGSVGAQKGYRSNCVTFVEAVLWKLGAILKITWPPYIVSGGGAPMLDLLLAQMVSAQLICVWSRDRQVMFQSDKILIGDVILVSTGTKLHHLAIYAGDNTVWHSLEKGHGVCTGNLFDPLIKRHCHSIWRAYA